MQPSDWLPIVENEEGAFLRSLGLEGYSIPVGGAFGNSLEYRYGAAWIVFQAVHPSKPSKAIRLPIDDRFAQEKHLQRLNFVAQKLDECGADWFPSFAMHSYEFAASAHPITPVMVMDWIDGEPYWLALWNRRSSPDELAHLQMQFSRLVTEMVSAGFDHGDISVSNLRVMPYGGLMLLDPDALSHKEMNIKRNLEVGHPTWNHTQRKPEHTEHLYLIPCELLTWFTVALQLDENLLQEKPDSEEFFFTEEDLADPFNSPRFAMLCEALGLQIGSPVAHPLFNLMNALCADFKDVPELLGVHAEEPVQPTVTIDYLLNLKPPTPPRPPTTRLGRSRRVLKPVSLAREFNRFKSGVKR